MITSEQHREIEERLARNRKLGRRDGGAAWDEMWRIIKKPPVADECVVGVEDEIRDLHKPIIEFCRERGWVYFYSNPTRKTGRGIGEPDFTVLADRSRVFFIECKARGQELSPGQEILQRKALYLGHTIEKVYTMDQFYRIVE